MITTNGALKKLQDGNQRFVSGVRSIDTLVKQMQRSDLVEQQSPFSNYNLDKGWFLITDIIITANWEASSGQ